MLADLDLRIQFANRPILGHSPDELIGRSILDLLPAEERDPVRAVYDRALATREPQTYELRHLIDGEVRWFENRVGLVMHESQPTGLSVASTEVTVRRRGEEALKIQARILDAMREGVVVFDSSSIDPPGERGYQASDRATNLAHLIGQSGARTHALHRKPVPRGQERDRSAAQ